MLSSPGIRCGSPFVTNNLSTAINNSVSVIAASDSHGSRLTQYISTYCAGVEHSSICFWLPVMPVSLQLQAQLPVPGGGRMTPKRSKRNSSISLNPAFEPVMSAPAVTYKPEYGGYILQCFIPSLRSFFSSRAKKIRRHDHCRPRPHTCTDNLMTTGARSSSSRRLPSSGNLIGIVVSCKLVFDHLHCFGSFGQSGTMNFKLYRCCITDHICVVQVVISSGTTA